VIDDRLDVAYLGVERVVRDLPLGQAGAAHVVANKLPPLRQSLVPMPARGHLPRVDVVPGSPGQKHQRQTLA
jgi:hypothetical protein